MLNFARASSFLFLLASISQTIGASHTGNVKRQAPAPKGQGQYDPNRDVPADAKSLPADCQDTLYNAGVTAAFKASKAYTNEYFVSLKFYTSTKDTTEVLNLPLLKGIKPIQVYTKDYDKGFSAKLSYEQVCSLDKDARVSAILICEGNSCAPEKDGTPVVPPPSKNSGIKGAPDVSGLSPECAKVVWYTIMEFNPETVDPGKYVAVTKIWVPQGQAEAYFSKIGGLIRNRAAEADGYYAGRWTYQQLCDIEKNNLISRVETMELPGAPPASAPKGKGGKGN